MSRATLQKLSVDLAAREHALAKLDGQPRKSAAELATRNQLVKEISALRRQHAAEEAHEALIRKWIAPRAGAGSPEEQSR